MNFCNVLRRALSFTLASTLVAGMGGLAGEHARADILFVDFNLSALELKAVQDAAQLRGESLQVLPAFTFEERALLDRKKSELNRADQLQIQLARSYTGDPAQQRELGSNSQRIARLNGELKGLVPKNYSFPIELEKLLEAAERKGTPITSMILSGHSNGEWFRGSHVGSELTFKDLERIFLAHPQSQTALRSLYLWGCYSNTPHMAQKYHRLLPHTQVIVGFSESAPMGYSSDSWALLKDALQKEGRLREQTDLKQALQVLSQLNSANQSGTSALVNSCYIGTRVKSFYLDDAQEHCTGAESTKDLIRLHLVFQKYFAAKPGFQNPPSDEHFSSLRDYYSLLQRSLHCNPMVLPSDLPTREQVLALIYFRNVRSHFSQTYSEKIFSMNTLLRQRGAPRSLEIPTLRKNDPSRQALFQLYSHQLEYISKWSSWWSPEEQKLAQEWLALFKQQLLELQNIPSGWITETPAD